MKIGISLSGGGAKGIAHVGVLQALLDHGIEIDVVAGTSAGAIVGALFAAGIPAVDMMDAICNTSFLRIFGLQWPNLQHPGTLDQQRTNAALHDPFPDPYAGPPNDSSRPREFTKPLPEPVRNKLVKDSMQIPR